MASYEIQWKRSAERELRNIGPKQIPKIIRAAGSLANNPFPPQCRKIRSSKETIDYELEPIE